jgi:transposase
VRRESHARFCERPKGKFLRSTHQRSGFCLWLKRLEEERFKWPSHLPGRVARLTPEQLAWLLDGLDLKHLKPHRALEYRSVL